MALKIDPWTFPDPKLDPPEEGHDARIVLGGGCFWCTEAVYRELDGVSAVRPGYAGGSEATAEIRTTGRPISAYTSTCGSQNAKNGGSEVPRPPPLAR